MNIQKIEILNCASEIIEMLETKKKLDTTFIFSLAQLGYLSLKYNRSKYEDGLYDKMLLDTRTHFGNDPLDTDFIQIAKLVDKVLASLFSEDQIIVRDIYALANFSTLINNMGITEAFAIVFRVELENQYIGNYVNFSGNQDIESFYGEIKNFEVDTDNSIYVTLLDQEDNYFDVSWDEIKNEEFDEECE